MEKTWTIETVYHFVKIFNDRLYEKFDGYNYQLTIFTDDMHVNSNNNEVILEEIIQQNPTTLLTFEKLTDYSNLLARSSSLYIFIQSQYSFESMQKVLKTINQSFKIRPRCLLVLLTEVNASMEESLMKFLSYVWSLKFLDFTVLSFNGNNCQVYNYIPFENRYLKKNLTTFSQVFPDKLNNVNGYPLNVPIYPFSSGVIISQDQHNNSQVTGTAYLYLEIFAKQLNFTLDKQFVHDDYQRLVRRGELFEKLERNEASMLPATYLMTTDYSGLNLSVSRPQDYDCYAILVPVLPESKLNLSYDVVAYVSLFPTIILLYMILVRLFRFPKEAGKFINILKVLLGWHLPVIPKYLHQRIVYLSLMFLTIQYTTIAFSKLLDVKMVHQENNFDTLDEVLTSNLDIYAAPYLKKTLQYHSVDDPEISKLESKIEFIDIIDCFEKIIDDRNCICLTPYNFLKSYMEANNQGLSRKYVKIANLKLFHDYNAFALERASPYTESFDRIVQRINEIGKPKVWIYANTTTQYENEGVNEDPIFLMQLAVILINGSCVGFIAFICECILARCTIK